MTSKELNNGTSLNLTPVPQYISFFMKDGSEEVLKLCDNGDIFVKGRLVENDKEVVDALRMFLNITSNKSNNFPAQKN